MKDIPKVGKKGKIDTSNYNSMVFPTKKTYFLPTFCYFCHKLLPSEGMIAEKKDIDYFDEDIELMTDIRDLSGLNESQSDAYVFISCKEGYLQMNLNGHDTLLERRMNIVCLPHTRINRILVSPDAKLTVVRISNRLVQGLMHSHIEQWNRAFYIVRGTVVQVNDELMQQIHYYYQLIMSKLHMPRQPYHKEVMRTIIRALLFEVLTYSEVMKTENTTIADDMHREAVFGDASARHFKAFLDVLTRTVVKHRSVKYYANKLCITPKHLTTICTQCSRKSAHQWITDMVNEDIRYTLLTTDLSVKEVADRLGFENTSFFGKYVRKHFGCTPLEFRLNHKNNVSSI